MKNFCNVGYEEMLGRHECECGRAHEITNKCLLKHGAFSESENFISKFVPPMSRVALIYDDDELNEKFSGYIKRSFRTVTIRAEFDKKAIEAVCLPEDTKLIVALGGFEAINCAKYKAGTMELPMIVASLPDETTFMPICYMKGGGLTISYTASAPIGLIYDLDIRLSAKNRAALLGMVAARLNTAFESYVSSLIETGDYCPFIAGMTNDIASKAILFVAGGKTPSVVNDTLAEAALKLSLLSSLQPLIGGEIQCAITFGMLNESDYLQGELQFVFAAVLTSLYTSHLHRRRTFTPPPDNNYRLERISELFGVSEYRALRLIYPQLSGYEASVAEYKLREYSSDMLEKLAKNKNLFILAFKSFKRMYSDGGYSLGSLVDRDISLSLALAPDMVKGSGMLSTLKRLGELDAYIV